MARIRTIKPEFWKHEGLCSLPESTHMLAAALLNYADDHGYFNANPDLIKGEIYPLRRPSVKIPESLRSLQKVGYIDLGTCPNGRQYGRIINFDLHQRVSHPSDSKISILSIVWDNSGNIPEDSQKSPETFCPEQGTGNREQGKERASARDLPEWIPHEAWSGFVEMRRSIRAPLGDRAQILAINTLEKLKEAGNDPAAVLDQSTQNSWRGLFPLTKGNSNGKRPTAHENFAAGALAAALERGQNGH